jgi:hypothetical protein
MTRDEIIAYLEAKISNKEAEKADLSKDIKLWEGKQILQLELEEDKQNKKLLDALEKKIAEKIGEKGRLSAEIAEHEVKLDDLRKAATILEAPQSGIYLSYLSIISYSALPYPILSYLILSNLSIYYLSIYYLSRFTFSN